MTHLFSNWEQISRKLARARTIALFLDFDGTLTRLRPRPEDVWLNAGARSFLARLAAGSRFRVWVISGRKQDDIRTRIRVPGIRYLGLHGWEGRLAAALDEATLAALATVKRQVGEITGHPDLWIEDKGAAIAFHYRSAAARLDLQSVLRERPAGGLLRMVQAKNVIEALPWEIEDKGHAVRHQMSTIRNATVPIYVGDDLIDEPAFRALSYGITVHVGRRRPTCARYWLPGVLQVHQLLEKLAIEFT